MVHADDDPSVPPYYYYYCSFILLLAPFIWSKIGCLCVFLLCFCLVGALQGFKLDDGIPPNHHLSNIRSVYLFRFFQDHIQKGIVSSQDSNQFAVPIQ
jgi:hypothetical protein